jgi:hypothetical protein
MKEGVKMFGIGRFMSDGPLKITDTERMDYLARHAELSGDGDKVTTMTIQFPADGQWEHLRGAVDDAIRAERDLRVVLGATETEMPLDHPAKPMIAITLSYSAEYGFRAIKQRDEHAPKCTAIGRTPAEAVGLLVYAAPWLFGVVAPDLLAWDPWVEGP